MSELTENNGNRRKRLYLHMSLGSIITAGSFVASAIGIVWTIATVSAQVQADIRKQDDRISNLHKETLDTRVREKELRQEVRDEIKEVKQDVKDLRQDVKEVLREIKRDTRR